MKTDDLAGQGRRKFLRWSAMGAAAVPALATGVVSATPADVA